MTDTQIIQNALNSYFDFIDSHGDHRKDGHHLDLANEALAALSRLTAKPALAKAKGETP